MINMSLSLKSRYLQKTVHANTGAWQKCTGHLRVSHSQLQEVLPGSGIEPIDIKWNTHKALSTVQDTASCFGGHDNNRSSRESNAQIIHEHVVDAVFDKAASLIQLQVTSGLRVPNVLVLTTATWFLSLALHVYWP